MTYEMKKRLMARFPSGSIRLQYIQDGNFDSCTWHANGEGEPFKMLQEAAELAIAVEGYLTAHPYNGSLGTIEVMVTQPHKEEIVQPPKEEIVQPHKDEVSF
jgi:hypothetical protein